MNKLGAFHLKLNFKDGKIVSKSADLTFNERYVESFKLALFKNANDDTLHNISGTLLIDLTKISVSFAIKFKSTPDRKDYDKLLFQGNVDICKVSRGVMANFMVKAFLSSERETNFHFDCPMKKGFYYLYNLPTMEKSFFPGFIPKYSRIWELTVIAKTKLPKIASAVQLLLVKV